MADPVTWVMILTAASGAIAAKGAMNQGKAEQIGADYRAAVAGNNAILAEQGAKLEEGRGKIEEQQQREKTAQLVGAQRAGYGAAGLDIAGGTPARIQADTAQIGEVDALTVRNNSMRKAYAYRTQVTNFESESQFETAGGKYARSAADLQSFGSLVGAASSSSSKWAAFKDKGAIK